MNNLAVPNSNTPIQRRPILRFIGRLYLRIFGWRLIGEFPNVPKCVTPVAPHTSNWDFAHAIAMVMATDLRVTFMGKHTLFEGFFGKFFYAMGGIPVVRHDPKGLIQQVADQLTAMDKAILAIAPEGTRKKTDGWKTGFLRIAYAADIPVIPCYIDYPSKTIAFVPPVELSGDLDTDMARVQAALKPYRGKYPDQHL